MSGPPYPDDKRKLVDKYLLEYFPAADALSAEVYEAMRYSLFSAGKRFRPVVALSAAEVLGGAVEDTLPVACAIEMVHTYSLIHDDLPAIDNDDLRRGNPTCHRRFGEDIAILAGDALYAEAFYLIASRQTAPSEVVALQLVRELASSTGVRGMVGGQVIDIRATGGDLSGETLTLMHERKTGELITFSARSGGLVAGASEAQMAALTAYAGALGLAFQITDDILDVTGETAVLGKTAGQDQDSNKATFPKVFGLDESRRLASEAVVRAKSYLVDLPDGGRQLAELADFVYQRES